MSYKLVADLPPEQQQALLALLVQLKSAPGAAAPGAAPPPITRATRKKKNSQQQAVKYLNDDELARLFGAVRSAGSVRDLAIFEVAYHRGLRATEVGLIQLGHWRQAQQRLYVTRLKNGISGEYLVTDREARALRAYIKKRPARSGPLFLSRFNRGISRFMLDKLMRRYGAAAALPDDKRHFHCLRHSCATSLLDRDTPVDEVQDHLGHKDIRNTMIYAKVSNAKRRRKDERLKGDW